MLIKFAVKNYRNFEGRFELDLSTSKDYPFNEACIDNKRINKALLYGENAVGKTNLGRALLDVRRVIMGDSYEASDNILNAWSKELFAEFEYIFDIEGVQLMFCYQKDRRNKVVAEKLFIENELLYSYNSESKTGDFTTLNSFDEVKHLHFDFLSSGVTIFRYVVTNARLDQLLLLKTCMNFIEGMAMIKPSDISASFYGPSEIRSKGIVASLIEDELVSDFQEFLKRCTIDLPLTVDLGNDGNRALYINYKQPISFMQYASSGTRALLTLYRILKAENTITFLFIDEYDANLHFGLASALLEYMKQETAFQMIITTHNTDLMSNKYMRPDCYFILTKERLTSIVHATKRELREGHNSEKLYQSGEFTS